MQYNHVCRCRMSLTCQQMTSCLCLRPAGRPSGDPLFLLGDVNISLKQAHCNRDKQDLCFSGSKHVSSSCELYPSTWKLNMQAGLLQAVQSGHRAAGAAGHLLCLPRQPAVATDLQRSQGAAEDCHALLPGLSSHRSFNTRAVHKMVVKAAEDCHVLLPGSQPQLIEQGSCRDPTTSLTTTAEHLSSKQEAAVVVAPEGKDTSNAGCFSAMGKAANL